MSTPLEEARATALKGDAETAIAILRNLAPKDPSASASLAELLAFKGEWSDVIVCAQRLINNPFTVYAGNVFDGMLRLLARAAAVTNDWDNVILVADEARMNLEFTVQKEHHRTRFAFCFSTLLSYCRDKGARTYFSYVPEKINQHLEQTKEEKNASYRDGVDRMLEYRPDLRSNKRAQQQHQFGLAKAYNQSDEAIRLYDQVKDSLFFDDAVYVATVYVDRCLQDRAWNVLMERIPDWFPVDYAQVAPVVLLTDEKLQRIMDA